MLMTDICLLLAFSVWGCGRWEGSCCRPVMNLIVHQLDCKAGQPRAQQSTISLGWPGYYCSQNTILSRNVKSISRLVLKNTCVLYLFARLFLWLEIQIQLLSELFSSGFISWLVLRPAAKKARPRHIMLLPRRLNPSEVWHRDIQFSARSAQPQPNMSGPP